MPETTGSSLRHEPRERGAHGDGPPDDAVIGPTDTLSLKQLARIGPEEPVTEYAREIRQEDGYGGGELHASFEVGVVLKGRMRRNHGGEWFELGRGQAWIVAPLQAHRWEVVSRGYTRIVFQMLPSFVERLPSVGDYDLMRPFLSDARLGPIGATRAFRQRLARLGDDIYAARPEDGIVPHGQALFDVLRLLPVIANHVIETIPPGQAPLGLPRRDHSVYSALELVERNTHRTVGLDEAALCCGMGRTLFAASFRACMGISFAQFQLRSRLALAAEMLQHTDVPLKALAAQFGFTDVSHFSKCFSRHYHATPALHRKNAMGDAQPVSMLCGDN